MPVSSNRLLIAAGLVWCAACGSDGRPSPATTPDPSDDTDAAAEDAGHDEVDAAESDSSTEDAGAPISSGCDRDDLTFTTASSRDRSFSAAALGSRVHLTYLVSTCGVTGSNGPRALAYTTFLTTGEASAPMLSVNGGATCALTRSPALIASENDGVEVVYGSNAMGSYALLLQDASTPADPAVLSDGDGLEIFAQATQLTPAGITTAVFSDQDGEPVPPVPAAIRAAQPGAAPVSIASIDEGFHARKIALAAAELGEFEGIAAWISDTAARPGVFARRLQADGSGGGDTISLSTSLGAYSDVALTARNDTAAVVYVVDPGDDNPPTLRFRAFDAQFVAGPEVRLTSANERVGAVAIAPYAQGYAVLYRRLSNATDPNPQTLRLLFIDATGNVAGNTIVGEDAGLTPDLQLLQMSDGRLVALWTATREADPNMPLDTPMLEVHAARLQCQ